MLDGKMLIWSIIRKIGLDWAILRLHPKSYLLREGWFSSFRKNASINRNGDPIPWVTYSFLHFIERRLNKGLRVFEYGCGNSTLWYAERVKEITAVEHNPVWAKYASSKMPSNGKIIQRTGELYVTEIINHGLFDIVIIDGIFRDQCGKACLDSLTSSGIIIWDNSDRDDFQITFPLLQEKGFREINFHGIAPNSFVPTQTSILYKPSNCLGI
jgi:hypothetical protein